jgi:GTPase SAR1 family protein
MMKLPEFAVLGHPNEGKSSVVSTLTEDDRIQVSPVPGETRVSKSYSVTLDGKEIIRFVDTPGFQVPRQTLSRFKKNPGPDMVAQFIADHENDPFFADECELLTPVANGAGIIYVVDGSRPIREDDLAEMEILRLTGRPRMAIINSKSETRDNTAVWKEEFRKFFNVVRVFNSNQADFYERIRLLESLKAIDQDIEPLMENVIQAFNMEWEKRNRMACAYVVHALEQSLTFSLSRRLKSDMDPVTLKEDLTREYQEKIRNIENKMFGHIRSLFRHHLYDYPLPACSILRHDLFSEQTWEMLGLTRAQAATAGAVLGGTLGVVLDTAAAGLTFGIFTAIGSALGAGSAFMGIRRLAGAASGLGGDRIQVGPNENIQFLYILLDRALLYYTHMSRRAHGRRDLPETESQAAKGEKAGISTLLTTKQHRVCMEFFKACRKKNATSGTKPSHAFDQLVAALLEDILQRRINP